MKIRQIVILLALLCLLSISFTVAAQEAPHPYHIVGYYMSYDIYEPDYYVTDIPAYELTDLIYGYIDISGNGQCISSDEWADTGYSYPGDSPNERVRGNFKQLR